MKTELHERLEDAFEPTPERFHAQVQYALRHPQPAPKRRLRMAAVLALCAALLCGTAGALDRIGVLHFFTTRMADGPTAVWMKTSGSVVIPSAQSCTGGLLSMEVRDVYLSADEIAVCVHIAPSSPERYRLLSETDIGTDGEHFDRIWWEGEVLAIDEWLPEGKEILVVSGRTMEIGGQRVLMSSDWVAEEAGETFLFRAQSWQAEEAFRLNDDGTLTIRIAADGRIDGKEGSERTLLECTVPIADPDLWEEE